MLLTGPSVGPSATKGAYVNLKIETLNTFVKLYKKLQIKYQTQERIFSWLRKQSW